jgi:alpha-beta hydrolase superfamily lysophospholipase
MTVEPSHTGIDAGDGHRIVLSSWLPATRPRSVVQIAHGMGEHAARYDRVAQALASAGHAVYANHHRGHGPDAAAAGQLGDFGRGGFAAVVADMTRVSAHARALHPGVPLLLLGHSMGSFAAQLYVLDHHRLVSGLALSGTAATELRFASRDPHRKLQDMNAGVEHPRTPFDWLSRDPREVDAYIADPLCGFTITPASRQSMFDACDRLSAPGALAVLPKDLPVYLFTGDQDPVNSHLAWFHPLVQRLRDAGLTDVQTRIYPGARHEVLNETNRDEVTADLMAWLTHAVAASPRR